MKKRGSTILIILVIILLIGMGSLITYLVLKPDKPKFVCGDDFCDKDNGENPKQCPKDCSGIIPNLCGNGKCDKKTENYQNCPKDCDDEPITSFCGDGNCNKGTGKSCGETDNAPECNSDCGSCPVANERNYFISKQGNDNNDGSEQNPWLTIQKAADSVSPGDIVYVKEGIYRESVTITKSGTQEKRIIFSNFQNDNVNVFVTGGCHGFYVEADYITIRGFNITDAYFEENAGCPDWTASGITTHKSNNIFENNEIFNSMYGILMRANIGDDYSGELQLPTEGSNMVRNNYIHNTDYGAIRVKRSNHNIVKDNKFYYNNQKISSFNDKEGNILTYLDAPLVFYCLDGLRIENNEFIEPKFGPAILELDMVTRTSQAPSMAPNPDETNCPLYLNNVIITNNTVYKTENQKYPIILTFGRDFALGSNNIISNNVWYNGNPGSEIIEWGYNFWHDNNKDDEITPSIWSLNEFQQNTGLDINSNDENPYK